MKRRVAVMVAVVLLFPLATATQAADVPGTTCSVFPADNVWNMDVRGLPVHRKSAV